MQEATADDAPHFEVLSDRWAPRTEIAKDSVAGAVEIGIKGNKRDHPDDDVYANERSSDDALRSGKGLRVVDLLLVIARAFRTVEANRGRVHAVRADLAVASLARNASGTVRVPVTDVGRLRILGLSSAHILLKRTRYRFDSRFVDSVLMHGRSGR